MRHGLIYVSEGLSSETIEVIQVFPSVSLKQRIEATLRSQTMAHTKCQSPASVD